MKSILEIYKDSIIRTRKTIKYLPLIFSSMIFMKLALNIGNNILYRLSISKIISNIVVVFLILFLISILLNMLNVIIHSEKNFDIEPITIPRLMVKVGINLGILFLAYKIIEKNQLAVLVLLILFNSLIETTYIVDEKFYMPIITTLKFTINNFFKWNIPNFIIATVFYVLLKNFYGFKDFAMSSEFVPISKFAILLFLISLFLLYRANLYISLQIGGDRNVL